MIDPNSNLLNAQNISFMNNAVELIAAVVLIVYFFFSLLVIRQVALLNNNFKTDAASFITSLAVTHSLLVFLLFIFALFSVIL